MSLRALWSHFPHMKHYFIAAVLIFAVGCYIGYQSPDQFQFILNAQQDKLKSLADMVKRSEHQTLMMFGIVLVNNLLTAALTIFLGSLFTVFPIYFLLTNGAMLGYLANDFVEKDSLLLYAKGILPHGIIEIPAILLAAAYGIRLGVLVIKGVILFPYPGRRARIAAQFAGFFKLTIPLVLLVTGMLTLAAVIESTVTPLLVGK